MRNFYLIIYYIFLRHLPSTSMPFGNFFNKLRSFIASKIFKSSGKDIVVKKGAYFGRGNLIEIGDRSQIGENARIEHDTKIGNDVMMGLEVLILSTRHSISNIDEPMISQGYDQRLPVKIKDGAWIGGRSIILPGITVGENSIVAAGSVVTKDVNEFEIVGGSPAKLIRNRKN